MPVTDSNRPSPRGPEGYLSAGNEPSAEEARLDMAESLFDPRTRRLLDQLGMPRGGRYLEVGAGHGRFNDSLAHWRRRR